MLPDIEILSGREDKKRKERKKIISLENAIREGYNQRREAF